MDDRDTASPAPTLMLQEASAAGAVVERQMAANAGIAAAIAARWRSGRPLLAATLARGSSDQAAQFAKHLLEVRCGIPVVSLPPSVGALYRATPASLAGMPLLAISQSGRSPDLIAAAEDARRIGAIVIAVVNDETSPLAELADHVLPIGAGAERSVAATKSFIATLTALTQLAGAFETGSGLDEGMAGAGAAIDAAFKLDWSPALPELIDPQAMLVLGRGPTLPIAGEAALKLKETCAIHAEAFSIAEVAHGPMTLVGQGDPVLVLAPSDIARTGTADRIRGFTDRGARVIACGLPEDVAAASLVLPMPHADDPALAAICQIAAFYHLVETLSRRRGRDPDRPPYLSKVTRTL